MKNIEDIIQEAGRQAELKKQFKLRLEKIHNEVIVLPNIRRRVIYRRLVLWSTAAVFLICIGFGLQYYIQQLNKQKYQTLIKKYPIEMPSDFGTDTYLLGDTPKDDDKYEWIPFYEEKNYQKVINIFNTCNDCNTGYQRIYLAIALTEQKKYEKAIKLLNTLLKETPVKDKGRVEVVRYYIAKIHLEQGNLNKAYSVLNKIIRPVDGEYISERQKNMINLIHELEKELGL